MPCTTLGNADFDFHRRGGGGEYLAQYFRRAFLQNSVGAEEKVIAGKNVAQGYDFSLHGLFGALDGTEDNIPLRMCRRFCGSDASQLDISIHERMVFRLVNDFPATELVDAAVADMRQRSSVFP